METTVTWCNSGSLSCIWTRKSTDYNELLTLTVSSSKPRIIWRILWRKLKNAKKNINIYRFSDSKRFGYEASEYAQNFDNGLMLSDSDDLSRSFSARFAAPNSGIDRCKRLIA